MSEHAPPPDSSGNSRTRQLRPKGRSRRSRNNNAQRRTASAAADSQLELPFQVRVPPVTSAASTLTPSRLSTVATPPRTGSIFESDEFLDEGFDMVPEAPRPEFAVQHQGFPDLIAAAYAQESVTNRFTTSNLPRSVYTYYCWQLLYARLTELRKFQLQDYDRDHYDIAFEGTGYSCPELIHRYLSGLGETIDQDNEVLRLAKPLADPNSMFSYAQYDEETSAHYEQLACPRILLDSMRADLAEPHAPTWTIDAPLRPADRPGMTVHETPNLLGYQDSVPPSPRDRPVYARLGILPDGDPPDARTPYAFSPTIMEYVSTYLYHNSKVRLKTFSKGIVAGSSAQLAFVSHASPDAHLPGSSTASDLCYLQSTLKLPSRTSAFAFAMCYRIREQASANGNMPFLGFTWKDQQTAVPAPPPAAYANRPNAVFNSDNNDRVNQQRFRSNARHRRIYLDSVSRGFSESPVSNAPI